MAVTAAETTTSFLSTTATATPLSFLSTRNARDNVTSRMSLMTVTITTNETSFNATTFPKAVIEGSGMGMVLLPFGIITVIGLAVAIMLYIRKRKRFDNDIMTLTTSQGTMQRPSRLVFTDVAKALNA
ncbi:hypothetical protein FQN60_009465 [Etheostoma spectabile]|uniref:Uncharacterized protein n=1 Tax=Etheostoma spectabile TaxID=54343 RepID=A0A5J5DJF3_9PERO|nr:hypothetical protein FQN60_009465 [Etheostoma spectabile]